MSLPEELMVSMIEHNFERYSRETSANKVLLQILILLKSGTSKVRQKDLIEKLKISKYKIVINLSYLIGAGLIENFGGMENSYYVTALGEIYLQEYLATKDGEKILEELNHG